MEKLLEYKRNWIQHVNRMPRNRLPRVTLNLLTTAIVAIPSNASKWQMVFNSAFKGLNTIPQMAEGIMADL